MKSKRRFAPIGGRIGRNKQKSRFREFTEQMLFVFNKTRKKRHIAVYEQAEIVSEDEERNVLNWAERFVNKTKEILEK